jgi:glycosyltransferase 2 family protein
MRRTAQIAISATLTLVIGYLIYRGVPDWKEALEVMIQGRPAMFIGGVVFVMLHMVLRALRWGVLLSPLKKGISFRNLFSLTLIKYVVNIIPPRTGEVAASVILARKEGIPSVSVIAASVLERVLDLVSVLFLFGVYLIGFGHRFTPSSERGREIILSVRDYSLKSVVVLIVAFVILLVLLRTKAWAERIPGRIRRIVLPLLEGLRALETGGGVVKAAILSVAIWLSITVQLWFLVRAYLDEFPFPGTLLLMALTVVGVAIPTPAGVGGFQFFMNLALVHLFSQYLSPLDPSSQAAGISNGCYLLSILPVIATGLVYLNYEGLTLGRLSRIGRQPDGQAQGA